MVTSTRDVLVVDPDPDLVTLLDLLLTDAGYSVRTATSLEDGARALRERAPHLVLADVRLPGSSPFALLTHLAGQETLRSLPVMLCTASIDDLKEARRWRDRPYTAALLKPFEIEMLLHCMEKLLDGGSFGLDPYTADG